MPVNGILTVTLNRNIMNHDMSFVFFVREAKKREFDRMKVRILLF